MLRTDMPASAASCSTVRWYAEDSSRGRAAGLLVAVPPRAIRYKVTTINVPSFEVA